VFYTVLNNNKIMNKILISLILISFTLSCNTTKKLSGSNDLVLFTYRKTECRGKCPVYYMEIFKSGKIAFEGTKNVDKLGKYHKQIGKKEIKKLISEFEKANFFGFENEYTALITDLPTIYIAYTKNGTTKTIRDYHGSPQELKRLEKLLDAIADGEGWTKI